MKAKLILYWMATTLIALETLAGGSVDLTRGRYVADVVTGLGYPVYILAILGISKIPGAITLIVPGFLRLKEWAYAGIVFELTGAAASQAVRGRASDITAPVVLLGLALASWGLRPPNRILGDHLLGEARDRNGTGNEPPLLQIT